MIFRSILIISFAPALPIRTARAMVVSGSCIGAHNTAVYWTLSSLGASTVIISLMATVSALPYTLFTLPAGAIADMVDRKKILLAVQLWHASIAIALAILWMAHLLNPYLILASAFLFSAGFAFGSPAHSSVIAEMVSSEELGSAYTLAGRDLLVLIVKFNATTRRCFE